MFDFVGDFFSDVGNGVVDAINGAGTLLFGANRRVAPPPAPPPMPDMTDQAVRAAALAQRRRLLLGRGLGSTFLSGPLGDASLIPTSAPSATGY